MTIRKVLRMGNPVLLQVARPVTDFNCVQLDQLLADMFDTMRALNGAGLAAPQIGVQQRVVIFGFDENPRYPDAPDIPLTVLINPQIEVLGERMQEQWEGCLSVPGMRAMVPRYQHIRYSGFDQQGIHFEREVSDFHARVVQHECDHLDGILYPQRVHNMQTFGFREALENCGLLSAQPCDD